IRQMSRKTPTVRSTCTPPGASLITNVHTAHTTSIAMATAMRTTSVERRAGRPPRAPRAPLSPRVGRSVSGTLLPCQVIDALFARPYTVLGTTNGSEENYFFFFQAEDGIRDGHVTGVQTCALPISTPRAIASWASPPPAPPRA